MISLWTSFKNALFKQCASKTSSKALLNGFQTAHVFKMKPKGAPKASHEPWFESFCSFWTPRGATMTLKRGCGTDYSLTFDDIHMFFVRFYVTFGMPLRCLEPKFSYLRTCKSHSVVNACWHKFHVRSHLLYAQQVTILRTAVDNFTFDEPLQKCTQTLTHTHTYTHAHRNARTQTHNEHWNLLMNKMEKEANHVPYPSTLLATTRSMDCTEEHFKSCLQFEQHIAQDSLP